MLDSSSALKSSVFRVLEELAMVVAVENDLHKLNEYLDDEEQDDPIPCKKVPHGDIYEAARAGDVDRLAVLLESGVNVNARDPWDSVALYYACLAGHEQAAKMLLENGAICSEHTFDGDRCHYAALNLRVRRLLKAFEARPPPLAPLPDSLRNLFFRSGNNSRYMDPTLGESNTSGDMIEPDIVFYVHSESISAHRAILLARCPFFHKKFNTEWKSRREVRLVKERLSFSALFSLIAYFYSDKLDVAVDDLEDLIRICKVCGCSELREVLEAEVVHQKYADYKALQDADDSLKRFIFLGSSLPPEQRLPYSMEQLLRVSLARSCEEYSKEQREEEEDHADICFLVEGRRFRCHRAILAARSDYIRARILRMNEFIQSEDIDSSGLPVLEEHDVSSDTFERLLRYIYTDVLGDIDLDQAEEMLDVASRYLMFPLKRAVADAVFPHLDDMSLAEICRWLLISDMYGVGRIKEYCLDSMAVNFELFANTPEFKSMLRTLPPPSGDSSTRTTAPSAPGGNKTDQGNLLDDLRERWLEAEGAELDKRDESAKEFDKVLEFLIASSIDDENTQDV